jgi:hypothetical protein
MAIELVRCHSGKMWDRRRSAEFDARCYRKLFAASYPATTFIPADVESSTITIGDRTRAWERGRLTREPLCPAQRVVDVSNRNWLTAQDLQELEHSGFRILSRRNLTSYLFGEQTLRALCVAHGMPEKIDRVAQRRADAAAISVMFGHQYDD